MNVLIAAVDAEPGGFTWTQPREIVYVAPPCDRDRNGGVAGGYQYECGCGRSFTGGETAKATTLAEVVDLDVQQLVQVADRPHWFAPMAELAARYPVGTLLRRRLDVVEPAS